MAFAARLEQAWYGNNRRDNCWLYLLLPLSWLFRFVAGIRRRLLASRNAPLPVPVVVVGNISLGGTGKTPLIISLVNHFTRLGYRPGVISRGYGGRAPGYPYLLRSDSTAAEAGDEPMLIAAHCPVVTDPDRYRGARHLLAETDCNLIFSDDGLQHYGLPRDVEIVVVDGGRFFGNGNCLPAGPLREPLSRLQDVDFVLVNGDARQPPPLPPKGLDHSFKQEDFFRLQPAGFRLAGSANVHSLDGLPRGAVHAVAGIGNPQRFADTLAALGFSPILHSYPDHHDFSGEEFVFSDALPVIITAKDAVKCLGVTTDSVWVLDVVATPARGFLRALENRLT